MKNKILPIVSVVVIIIVLLLAVFVTGGSDKEPEDNRNHTVYKVKKVAENCPNCIFTIGEISFGPSNYSKNQDSDDENYMYSQFYEEGDDYVTDYNKIKNREGVHRPIFLAATMNTDKYVLNVYTCGL